MTEKHLPISRASGCGTGTTRYRAVEALDANGERSNQEERLVYMNGLERPLPALHLSGAARQRLADWGPYTQPFDRLLPVLQPSRLELVMDNLLARTLVLLGGRTGGAVTVGDAARRLLARPAVNPGGATYVNSLRPLAHCDTKSCAAPSPAPPPHAHTHRRARAQLLHTPAPGCLDAQLPPCPACAAPPSALSYQIQAPVSLLTPRVTQVQLLPAAPPAHSPQVRGHDPHHRVVRGPRRRHTACAPPAR